MAYQYQQHSYQYQRVAGRHGETFPSDQPWQWSMTQPRSNAAASAPSPPSAPAMSYTSSTDSNRSAYDMSSASSLSSSPRLANNHHPLMPSPDIPNAGYGSAPRYDQLSLHGDVKPAASPSEFPGTGTRERSGDRYICLFPGCPGSFSRPADLSRHQSSVHLREQNLIDCPVPHCPRKGNSGITRPDHLNTHLRRSHGQGLEKYYPASRPQGLPPSSPSF